LAWFTCDFAISTSRRMLQSMHTGVNQTRL
jgi:hypothetical protein